MTDFILPDIGEGVVECELLEWLVKEGDRVEEDQPVAEVMTDKATVQIPSMHSGTITKLFYKAGDIAKVHAPLFAMARDGETEAPVPVSAVQTSSPTYATEVTTPSVANETFILPDIGEGIVECEIVKWHLNEGDHMEEDDVVVEVMTDKAVVEIPAKYAGVMTKRYHQEGEIAKVHEPLFEMSVAGREAVASMASANTQQTPPVKSEPSVGMQSQPVAQSTYQPSHGFSEGSEEPVKMISGKVAASPAVRRLARENGVDLKQVNATGKKGRVLKKDVLAVLNSAVIQPNANDVNVPVNNASVKPVAGDVKRVPLTPVQRAMAKQMTRSVSTIPHFTVSEELDMRGLINLKAMLSDTFAKQDIKLTYMPFFIKALSLCMQEYPIFNARLSEDETALDYLTEHNIGFAVDSPIGLLVPNIKGVQDLSVMDIARQMQSIVQAARAGKLSSEQLKGGTISISNVGVLGGTTATPIINHPELAIVALGKMQTLPRFDANGNVISASIMHLSWSADHRVIDGATMVKFNNLWCDYLSEPVKMLSQLR
ncbi:dihydrolipoyllysine-residue acetyltransferase [Alteromonas sp. AMM-1]|uniref:dihydrolipoyllysine-residue acetyltransferase n=1 Tax=Alteromonas sp. AMM-1 TaxID=3394233 RepID=UPI0039A4FBD9